jgi:hypothetical protein
VRYFTPHEIVESLKLGTGQPLPKPPAALADDLRRLYVRNGYWFAAVTARFEEEPGRLVFDVDEGRIDAVEFVGAPQATTTQLSRDFALQPGDVFRQPQAANALRSLLKFTRGAIAPVSEEGHRHKPPGGAAFEMIDRDGKRVLVVHLAARRSDFNLSLGTEGREDWFSPVDGFNPAVGFNETIFDPVAFNHAYITGYVSYKVAAERAGYMLGLERPFLEGQRIVLGAELHDQSASDDLWRLAPVEQSLVAAGWRETFRDYYRRTGYQVNAALRLAAGHELMAAWRDERQEALANSSDFSVFQSDEPWRPNAVAEAGRLHALVFGYTWDSRGLGDESLERRYERHQMADLFGTSDGDSSGWRVEWTSEIADSARLGGDFTFRRHILNVRRYERFTPHHTLNVRALAAVGQDALPPQRLLGLGDIGTIPGYGFKEALGERMALVSVEYKYRLARDIRALGLYDVGRVFRPVAGSSDAVMHAIGTGVEFGGGFRVEGFFPLTEGRGALMLVRLRPDF